MRNPNEQNMVALDTLKDGRPISEEEQYEYKAISWKDFTKAKYIPWWIVGIITAALVTLLAIYHDPVVQALRPVSLKIQHIPGGFAIPIAILVIISFPPLFGHEIIALLCGVVYGLWIGFAIVAAGTFLGEVGTWFAFKKIFRAKAIKLEKTNLNYGALARLTRDGGFWIVLVIRFSAMPSHFSTAVFATCGVKFWAFLIATFLTLPKQIIIVYLGVVFAQAEHGVKDTKINDLILLFTFVVTLGAAIYIYWKMNRIKKMLLEEQTARLQGHENKQRITPEENPFDDRHGHFQPPTQADSLSRQHQEQATATMHVPRAQGRQQYGSAPGGWV